MIDSVCMGGVNFLFVPQGPVMSTKFHLWAGGSEKKFSHTKKGNIWASMGEPKHFCTGTFFNYWRGTTMFTTGGGGAIMRVDCYDDVESKLWAKLTFFKGSEGSKILWDYKSQYSKWEVIRMWWKLFSV